MADKTVVVRLALKANGFSNGLKRAGADVQDFGVQVERGTQKAGSSALALGAASATAGKLIILGIGGAMAVSAKAAIDFESSLIGVAKTTDLAGSVFDRASGPLANFGDRLRELSLRVPVNVNDLARIAELGGQLGIQVPNLINFTETVAALGVTTNLSTERAATSLARIANIMGTSQSDFARMGGIIVELGNNFATTESEIVNFATRIAPALKAVGGTEEDLFALSAALTSLGVPAERGGTALQRFFIDVARAVDQGGEKLEAFAKASGVTAEEFTQAFRDSPADAFEVFVKGLDEIQEAGGSVFQTLRDLDIQEQRSIQVLLAASNGWETVADAIESARVEGEKAGDALFEEAARRYGTTASQIQLVANAFNDLRIEIGNALLGSGGLAAGIDFFREFFGIVKDNLPLIGRLATALAVVAGLRIGASFATMAVQAGESIRKFIAMKTATEGVTRSMAAARLAALGLNTALWGALAVVGLLVTKWAMAAQKAAELKTAARELAEQLQTAEDPYAAIIQSLEDANILTDERKRALVDLGISERDFIDALLGEKNAVSDLNDELFGSKDALDSVFGADVIKGGSLITTEADKARAALMEVNDALDKGGEILDATLDVRRTELTNTLLEAGLGAQFTTDQLKGMADQALRVFGLDITDSELMSLLTPQTAEGGGIGHRMQSDLQQAEQAFRGWMDLVGSRENGSDTIDTFFEGIESGITDFNEFLAENFSEIDETIRGSFPTWDEYEQTTIESLDAVIAAQDLYIEDLRAGFALQDELVEGTFGVLSPRTLEWFENLDAGTKGALGRMRDNSDEEFQSFIDEVDANFLEIQDITTRRMQTELPGIAEAGFSAMVSGLLDEVSALEVPGREAIDALQDGMEFQLSLLPANLKPIYAAQMLEALQDEQFLRSMGFDITDPIIQGLIDGLSRLADMVGPSVNSSMEDLKERLNGPWEVESPSKVTMRLGYNIAEGLKLGYSTRMNQINREGLPDFMPFSQPSTSTTNSNVNNTRNIKIEVNNARSNDLKTDLQYAGLLASQVVIAN